MTDATTALLTGILPGLTLKVVDLIAKMGKRESAAIQRLQNLELDLNVIHDVVLLVNSKHSSNDGVQRWAEVAEKTVNEAQKLVQKIDEKMNTKWRQKIHKVHSFINKDEIEELDNLLKKFDSIKSHNQTILTLIQVSK